MPYSPMPMPVPIFIPSGESSGNIDISSKELGISIIIIVLWVAGLFKIMQWFDDKYDSPGKGLLVYFLATGALIYFLG